MSKTIIEHDGKRYEVIDSRPVRAGDLFLADLHVIDILDAKDSVSIRGPRAILRELPAEEPEKEPEYLYERTGEFRKARFGEWCEREGRPVECVAYLGEAKEKSFILRRAPVEQKSPKHPLPWVAYREKVLDANGIPVSAAASEDQADYTVAAANELGAAR